MREDSPADPWDRPLTLGGVVRYLLTAVACAVPYFGVLVAWDSIQGGAVDVAGSAFEAGLWGLLFAVALPWIVRRATRARRTDAS